MWLFIQESLQYTCPCDWLSIYQMLQKSRQALRNKVEMAHILIQQGIEKGSRKWKEMQQFTEQLDTEQVSPQEIMEHIQQCMNT